MTKPISAFDRIEHLAPTGLIAYDRNARKHPKQQIRRIADSIRSFGFNAPVLINAFNVVLAVFRRAILPP